MPTVSHTPSAALAQALDRKLVIVDKGLRVLPEVKPIATLTGHGSYVLSLCVLDAQHFCSSSRDGTLRVWNSHTLECEAIVGFKKAGPLHSMCTLTHEPDLVCIGCGDKRVLIRDSKQENVVTSLHGHTKAVSHVRQLHDGRLVSASHDNTLKIWDIKSQQCVATLKDHTDPVYSVIELSDGRLCSTSYDKTIKIWSESNNKWSCVGTLQTETDSNFSVCEVTPGVIWAAYGYESIGVWDLASMEMVKVVTGHTGPINCFVLLVDGRVCTASDDTTVRIWDVYSGNCLSVLKGNGLMECVLQLPDGRLCAGSRQRTIFVWDPFEEYDVEWSDEGWKAKPRTERGDSLPSSSNLSSSTTALSALE